MIILPCFIQMFTFTDKLKDDLRFARHVEKAWIDHNQDKFTKKNTDDFLEEIDRC